MRTSCRAAIVLLATACAGARPVLVPRPLPDAAASAPGRYGPEPGTAPTPLELAATEAVLATLPPGPARPAVSPSLALAARELARRAAAGEPRPLARQAVRAALSAGLSFDPAPDAVLVASPPAGAPGALRRAAALDAPSHLGVGAAERDGTAWLVLLSARRLATLSPFPREVAPGARAALRGQLIGLSRPTVFVTLPSGDVREVPASGERSFAAELSFPAPGRYVVEVLGTGQGGPAVAALLSVSCGGATLAGGAAEAEVPEPADPAAAEAQVRAAIDAARLRHGLSRLDSSPELREEARAHSRRMLASGTLAHVLPGRGDVGERLRLARIPYRSALENIARGGSALAAHAAAEESPAHRRSILSPLVDRVGVGIARGRSPVGEPVVYLTEIFVQPIDDGSEGRLTPEGRVKEALWRERERLHRPSLLSDPRLDALAREAARAMLVADDPAAQDLAARALGMGRRVGAADAFVAASTAEVVRSRNLPDPRFRRVGVGVATGESARYGAGLLWIAVVYTD